MRFKPLAAVVLIAILAAFIIIILIVRPQLVTEAVMKEGAQRTSTLASSPVQTAETDIAPTPTSHPAETVVATSSNGARLLLGDDTVTYVSPSGSSTVLHSVAQQDRTGSKIEVIATSSLQLSPEGHFASMTLEEWEWDEYRIYDLANGEDILQPLESAISSLGGILWSPDDSWIVIHSEYAGSDHGGTEAIYLYDVASKEWKTVAQIAESSGLDSGYPTFTGVTAAPNDTITFDRTSNGSYVVASYSYDISTGALTIASSTSQ